MSWLIWAFVTAVLRLAVAEVLIFTKTVPTIYDDTLKLRIFGTGFDADEKDILLEIKGRGEERLDRGDHFIIRKFDGGIVLHLLMLVAIIVETILKSISLVHAIVNANRRKQYSKYRDKWTQVEDNSEPIPLIISSVKFASNPTENMLQKPVTIANVLMLPKVEANNDIIFATTTKELHIKATGLIGISQVVLNFVPPLYINISYSLVSPFPLQDDELVLRLLDSQEWRQGSGSLRLVSIDIGGGLTKTLTSKGDGVIVAQVNSDLNTNSVTVRSSAARQLIYHDEPRVTIWGSGFSTSGNSLRFSNGIMGRSVNYTITGVSNTLITLRLIAPSVWYNDLKTLPRMLTVLSVNSGEGFLPQGLENVPKGCHVATVFELPHVSRANTEVYRTKSREFSVYGRGFTDGIGSTRIKFYLPLDIGTDYNIEVISRTEMRLTLLEGKKWRSKNGPLHILAINTRGDDAGWIRVGGHFGIVVAQVVDDSV